MLKIAMIAGEASGDMLASSIIRDFQDAAIPAEFVGIGGKMMQDLGFKSWHNMDTLSVMGYIEVIKSLPQILKLRAQILRQLLEYKPDVFIGVDAPDFNFYIEKKLKDSGIKTVHYISPTIWAWRYERIFKIKKSTDLMLCIFPFEENIYHKEGILAKFVGHPMAQDIEMDIDTNKARDNFNISQTNESIIGEDATVITVLCGSRKREIKSSVHILIETCNLIAQKIPNTVFIFPFTNESILKLFNKYLAQTKINFNYKVVLNQTRDAIKAANLVIAKSGTVSLEAALCKKPMLIYYKVNKFTAWVLKHKIKIKHVGQPNIIMGREIVKEFLQDDANPQNMSEYILNLYQDKNLQENMIRDFYQLHKILLQDRSSKASVAILNLVQA